MAKTYTKIDDHTFEESEERTKTERFRFTEQQALERIEGLTKDLALWNTRKTEIEKLK